MKAILPILAILGVAGAVGMLAWSSDSEGAREERASPGQEEASTSGRDRSLDALERRISRLEREVRALKVQPRGFGPTPEAVAEVDLEDPDAAASPVLRQAIEDVVDEREASERVERDEQRRQFFTEMRTERVDALATAADLDDDQRAAIEGLWEAEQEHLMGLITQVRSGEISRMDVREQMEAMATQTDQAAAELLDDEQMEAYAEQRPRGPGGGGGGPRGGAGRGGPAPGG